MWKFVYIVNAASDIMKKKVIVHTKERKSLSLMFNDPGCFVQPLEDFTSKPVRIIIFDFEVKSFLLKERFKLLCRNVKMFFMKIKG